MAEAKPVTLWRLVGYFLRLGSPGFGGPIALAGYMQRDLVPRKWITPEEYAEGLAFSQMMPGPLAAQLAMWIGYVRHGDQDLSGGEVAPALFGGNFMVRIGLGTSLML